MTTFLVYFILTLDIFQHARCNYLCEDGKEVKDDNICDGEVHCEDGLDESVEMCFYKLCPKDTYKCAYGACIPILSRCDGKTDCSDGSDEHYCNTTTQCNGNLAFQCLNGKCISDNLTCNNVNDCGDYSDEAVSCRNLQCSQLQFKCKNGGCISKEVICDGHLNCYDGSDENKRMCEQLNCNNKECTTGKLLCPPIKSHTLHTTCSIPGVGPTLCDEEQIPTSVASMECDNYYEPVGDDATRLAYCQQDGRWSSTLLTCKPKCGINDFSQLLIANGYEAQNWPWHAVLYASDSGEWKFICGGTLISEYVVVTAAHCTWRKQAQKLMLAFAKYITDITAVEEHSQIRNVSKIIMQPNYYDFETNYGSDISVLFLDEPIKLTPFVRPACIDWSLSYAKSHLNNSIGLVAGMGVAEDDRYSQTLKTTSLPVVSTEECISNQGKDFRKYITYTTFCAGWRNESGVCNGDSGGGLLFEGPENEGRWYLQGVVSISPRRKGMAICDTKRYTIFTKISSYLSWLKEVVPTEMLDV